jgi:hypothetical protein
MNLVFKAAKELQDFCDAQGWRSCIIGGVAVQRWGQARVTKDVDLNLVTERQKRGYPSLFQNEAQHEWR